MMVWPVIISLPKAKNSTTSPRSSGALIFLSSECSTEWRRCSGVHSSQGLYTAPGAMPLTRTDGASALARFLVRLAMAALVAEYAILLPPARKAAIEAVLTIDPPAAFRAGAAAL